MNLAQLAKEMRFLSSSIFFTDGMQHCLSQILPGLLDSSQTRFLTKTLARYDYLYDTLA